MQVVAIETIVYYTSGTRGRLVCGVIDLEDLERDMQL